MEESDAFEQGDEGGLKWEGDVSGDALRLLMIGKVVGAHTVMLGSNSTCGVLTGSGELSFVFEAPREISWSAHEGLPSVSEASVDFVLSMEPLRLCVKAFPWSGG
jgi:hypothetical protein